MGRGGRGGSASRAPRPRSGSAATAARARSACAASAAGAAPHRLGAGHGSLHHLLGPAAGQTPPPRPDAPYEPRGRALRARRAGRAAAPRREEARARPAGRRQTLLARLRRDPQRGPKSKGGRGGTDCVHAAAEALPDERGVTTAAFLERASSRFAGLGVRVERVLTDNGGNFISGAFRKTAAAHGGYSGRGRTVRRPTARLRRSPRSCKTSGHTATPTP